MPETTSIRKICERGVMSIPEFFENFAFKRPRRTHFLRVRDYVLSQNISRGDRIRIERVAELGYLEPGDFRTERGTTGPISGNVFVGIRRGEFPECILIEGDRVEAGNGSVYDSINNYLRLLKGNANQN